MCCDCLVYRPRGLHLLGSLDNTVFHSLEERPLALRRRYSVRWLGSAFLPNQARVVEGNDVAAFGVTLFVSFDRYHVSDHLALGVEHRAAVSPFPISDTDVL